MGPFSPVKVTAFHQQTVSRVTQDREAERHDEDQQVHEAPVTKEKGKQNDYVVLLTAALTIVLASRS